MISETLAVPLIKVIAGIAIMSAVSYLSRVLTLVFIRRKITNTFLKSLITYIPYGIIASMVFPEIIYSTSSSGNIVSSAVLIATIAGTVVAIVLSLIKGDLFIVSMSSVATVLILILILQAAGVA